MRARERLLRADVVAVARQAAEVRRAGFDEFRPPVGEVRRHLDPHVRHQPPALGDQTLHVLHGDRIGPAGQGKVIRADLAAGPALAGGLVGDVGDLGAVIARMGDEVLEDHLLDVPVGSLHLGDGLERGDPLLLALADPDEDPGRERDLELTGDADRLQPLGGVLGGGTLVDD